MPKSVVSSKISLINPTWPDRVIFFVDAHLNTKTKSDLGTRYAFCKFSGLWGLYSKILLPWW